MAHANILPDRSREKLIRCLRLLGSDHAGERDGAGLAAQRILVSLGLDWGDVVGAPPIKLPQARQQPDPPPSASGWRADVQRCQAHLERLTPWERQFVSSLAGRHKPPSDKQRVILAAIVAKVTGR